MQEIIVDDHRLYDAQIAKERTKIGEEKQIKEQFIHIIDAILDSVEYGSYSVTLKGLINEEHKKKLEDLGYEVSQVIYSSPYTYDGCVDDAFYTISWE